MDSRSTRRSFAQRHLDPASRLGEVLFGLIMVLSFTLTAGVTAPASEAKDRQLLWAAIGCNLAWGIIDAVMYVMNGLTERGGRIRLARKIQAATATADAVDLVRAELDPDFKSIAPQVDREVFYGSIAKQAADLPSLRNRITREDLMGGLACFLLVFFSCLPAALPFFIFKEPQLALRVSNFLLIALLFVIGQQWGEYAQTNRWLAGLAMVMLGLSLVGVAILLGG